MQKKLLQSNWKNCVFSLGLLSILTISTVCGQAFQKVLFVGNSISSHGSNPSIGWKGDWGMAASSAEKDYVHRVMAGIHSKSPGAAHQLLWGVPFEQNWNAYDYGLLTGYKNFGADLIIMRIGENVKDEDVESGNLRQSYLRMIDGISTPNSKIILTTSFWKNHDKFNAMVQRIATERNLPVVNLTDLSDNPANTAHGLFENPGVAAHPGDKGMEEIANRILASLSNSSIPVRSFSRYLSFSIMNVENGDYYLPVMEKAAAAGVNTFLLNVNWDHVIPTRGAAPDWSQLDRQAELAERLGCKLIIKVWLARHDDGDGGWWPEGVRPISGEGIRHRLVNGFSYSASSAVEEANSFFRTVMEHFRPRQQAGQIVTVTAVTNNASEIGYSVDAHNPATGKNELQSFDFSSYSKEAFREWVEAKYKTLSNLNKAWNSDYSRFSDVHPPYTRGDVWSAYYGKIGLDWYLYRHYALRNVIRKFRNTSKEVDPSYKFFLDMGSSYDGLTNLRGTFGFKDIVGEADGLKVNDGPNYPHRFAMDLLRTNLPGKMIGNEFEFISPETASQWPNQINQSFEHGANWINIFGFDNSSRFPYVEGLIKATAAKWLHLPVPDIQPTQTVTYTLSEAIRMGTGRVQGQWRDEYAKTYTPIKVILVEDALTEVIPENQSPVVKIPLADQRVEAGKDFQYSVPEGTFSDPDGYIASIAVTGLPEGISVNGNILTGKTSQIGEYIVTVTARDNAGAQVSTQFRLTVWAVPSGGGNQPPMVSRTIPNQTATAGTAFGYSIPTNTFTDAETPSQLTLSVSGLPDGLMFTAPATISGTPTASGTSSVTVTATDPGALSASTTFAITVNPASVDPTGKFAITGVTMVSCSPVPGNPNQRSLTFNPQYSGVNGQPITFSVAKEMIPTTAPGPHKVVIYIDNPNLILNATQQGTSGQVSFVYNWLPTCGANPTNMAPTVANAIPNQTATVGQGFAYEVGRETFTDADGTIAGVSFAGLPAGVSAAEWKLSGTPTAAGAYMVTVTARDNAGAQVSTQFRLTVSAVSSGGNQPPVVSRPIPDQSGTVGTAFSYTIPTNTFTDVETPSQLTLSVIGLPAGLMFTAPATISGTPTARGTSSVTVTATDPGALSASTVFGITVNEPTPGTFAITDVTMVSCSAVPGNSNQRSLTFTPQYSGANGQPITFSVAGETAPTTAPGPYKLIVYMDNPIITLKAIQQATSGEVRFVYNWLAACGTKPTNMPPTVAKAIPDQAGTVGASFTYEIPKETFTDADGTVAGVSFAGLPAGVSATEWKLSGTPAAAGDYTVTVTARDNAGAQVSTQFKLKISAVPVVNTISLFTAGNFITRRFVRDILEGDTLTGEEMKQSVNIMVSPKSGTVGSYSFALSGPVSITSEDSSTPYGVFGDNGGNVLSPGKYTLTVKSYASAGLQGSLLSQQVLHFVVMEKTGQQNLPPVLKNPPGTLAAKVGKPFTHRLPDGIFVDPDGFLTSFTITELPEGLKGEGTLISGTPTKKGAFTSKVRVMDNGGSTAEATFQFIVSTDNLPPVVKGSIPDQIAEVNKPFTFTLPNNIFVDPDGTIMSITFIGPPEGTLGQGYSITGVPNKVREYPIIVIASDDENANAQITFTIRVVEANRPPVVAKTIVDQLVEGNSDYRFVIPEGTFVDPDGRIARTEFSGLPPGVKALGDTISGRPNPSGEYVVSVRAYDDKGASVQTTFKFTVKAAKQGPTVAPISDVIAIIGQTFAFDVKSYFKDDEGSITSITYVSALPPGITASGSQLSGNPTAVGVYPMKVVAKDKNGGSIEASFQLKVEKPVLRVLLYAMGQGTKKLIREVANTDKMAVDTLPPALNLFVESNATLTSVTFEIVNPMPQRSTDEAAPFGLLGDTGSFPAVAGTYTINVLGYQNTTLVASRLIEFTITKTVNSPGRLGTIESEYISDVELWKPYPVPFVDRVKVRTAPQGYTELHAVEVLSSEGKILPLPTSKWTVDQSLLEVDLSETVSLPGVYMLRITEDSGKQRTLRILKAAEN